MTPLVNCSAMASPTQLTVAITCAYSIGDVDLASIQIELPTLTNLCKIYSSFVLNFEILPTVMLNYAVLFYLFSDWSRRPSSSDFSVPRTRTKFRERAFSYAGPSTWNTLPRHIRQTVDSASFRKPLKTHYFTSAFGVVWFLQLFYIRFTFILTCIAPMV